MPTDNPKLSRHLSTLCHQGCTTVREVIEQLETGSNLPELSELNDEERQQLLQELKNQAD